MLTARWLSPWLAAIAAVSIDAANAEPTSERYQLDRRCQRPASRRTVCVDAHDVLYAAVVGHRLSHRHPTGAVTTFVGAPEGMADDLVFLADGTVVWTSIQHGVVRARKGDGPVVKLADLVSVNSINVRKDGRLFAAQVFGGDGLWEIDPAGAKPPRLILKDLGGFNGFDIGPDGKLYGPLWFKHQVVRIDPDTGMLDVIADGFDTPAAADFDSKWNLYVLDTARGEVVRVDIRSGRKQVVAKVAPSLDNLASIAPAFVSTWRTTASGKSMCATAPLARSSRDARDSARHRCSSPARRSTADTFALRTVDGRSKAPSPARARRAQVVIRSRSLPISATSSSPT
jgi:hypothetical protein